MFVLAFISENLAWQKEHSRRGNKTVLNLINFFILKIFYHHLVSYMEDILREILVRPTLKE